MVAIERSSGRQTEPDFNEHRFAGTIGARLRPILATLARASDLIVFMQSEPRSRRQR